MAARPMPAVSLSPVIVMAVTFSSSTVTLTFTAPPKPWALAS